MNILYVNTIVIDPIKGGLERNTVAQANYFEKVMGYKTWFLGAQDETMQADARRQHYLPLADVRNIRAPENVEFFKNFLKEHHIDVVINQVGTCKNVSGLAYHARSVGVKLISVFRRSIQSHVEHARYFKYEALKKRHLGFMAPLLSLGIAKKILLSRYRRDHKKHYKNLCANSDRLILLSERYKPHFAECIEEACPPNVIAIPNPYPFAETGAVDLSSKEKEILFVGRFNFPYKRVDLVVRIWAKLFRDFPDWKLRMVGNGPEFDNMVNLAKKLKVERLIFEGFKPAEEFYRKASLSMLTSTSEGFPMALVEALGAGCVPFAFHSFATAFDIIDDGKNGVLVKPFDCGLYAKKLAHLMRDDALRRQMAANAMEKAKEFAAEKVYGKWIAVIESLCPRAKT